MYVQLDILTALTMETEEITKLVDGIYKVRWRFFIELILLFLFLWYT